MTVKIKPLGDRALVKPRAKNEMTKSGIVIPDTAKEKPQEGEVLAIGPGRLDEAGKRIPMEIKVGDIVVYSKYGGTEMEIDGQDLVLLSEADIFAKHVK